MAAERIAAVVSSTYLYIRYSLGSNGLLARPCVVKGGVDKLGTKCTEVLTKAFIDDCAFLLIVHFSSGRGRVLLAILTLFKAFVAMNKHILISMLNWNCLSSPRFKKEH